MPSPEFKLLNVVENQIYSPPYEMREEALYDYAARINSGWYASGSTGPWVVVSDEEVPETPVGANGG